jgi:hypothetical protein
VRLHLVHESAVDGRVYACFPCCQIHAKLFLQSPTNLLLLDVIEVSLPQYPVDSPINYNVFRGARCLVVVVGAMYQSREWVRRRSSALKELVAGACCRAHRMSGEGCCDQIGTLERNTCHHGKVQERRMVGLIAFILISDQF